MIETRYQHVKHSIRDRDSALLGMKGIMAKPAEKIRGSKAEAIARRSKSSKGRSTFSEANLGLSSTPKVNIWCLRGPVVAINSLSLRPLQR